MKTKLKPSRLLASSTRSGVENGPWNRNADAEVVLQVRRDRGPIVRAPTLPAS